MVTQINGITADHISALDRGLLYGQNVFETIAVSDGKPLLVDLHIMRLRAGCQALSIPYDVSLEKLILDELSALCEQQQRAVVRLCLSMGEGGRGYRNPAQAKPNRILSLHDFPKHPIEHWQEGIELGLVSLTLASQPVLAGIKHGNRLEQIIARSQWQDDWQEALLCDQSGSVIEATQSNVFIARDGAITTPRLDQCGVAGVMREWVLENASKVGVECAIMPLSVADIEAADEVFVSNSLIGLWPVKGFRKNHYSNRHIADKLLNLMKKNEVIPNF